MKKSISSDELLVLRLRSSKYANLADKLRLINRYLSDNRNDLGDVVLNPKIVDRIKQIFLHHINCELFYNINNPQTYGKKTFR